MLFIFLNQVDGIWFKISNLKSVFRTSGFSIFFNKNISVKNIATVNSIEAIKNLVISNIGYSIVPKISILKEYKTGLLNYYEIEDLKIIRNFKLISLKNKVINNHLNAVLELIKKSIIEEKDLKKWIF